MDMPPDETALVLPSVFVEVDLETENEGIDVLLSQLVKASGLRIALTEEEEKLFQIANVGGDGLDCSVSGNEKPGIVFHIRAKWLCYPHEINMILTRMACIAKSGDMACIPAVFGKLLFNHWQESKSSRSINACEAERLHGYL